MPTTFQIKGRKKVVTGNMIVKTEADTLIGADGEVLVADSGAATGVSWGVAGATTGDTEDAEYLGWIL